MLEDMNTYKRKWRVDLYTHTCAWEHRANHLDIYILYTIQRVTKQHTKGTDTLTENKVRWFNILRETIIETGNNLLYLPNFCLTTKILQPKTLTIYT